MYNHQLDTFLAVAECGSFSKAAQQLYITPTAVMKQVNLLEENLELQLFERTYRGLMLTAAGKSLYKDAQYLIQFSNEALFRAKKAEDNEMVEIRVGTSLLTPTGFLTALWPRLLEKNPNIRFQFVPYQSTPATVREIFTNFGQNVDIIFGIFDEELLKIHGRGGTILKSKKLCCGVPLKHPLAQKPVLTMEDLRGERIMIMRKGWTYGTDYLREDLVQNYPDIEISDFDFFSMEVFNQCEEEGCLLITVNEWETVHPLLKIIPVEWQHSIPFGMIHSASPSEKVLRFIKAVQDVCKDMITE